MLSLNITNKFLNRTLIPNYPYSSEKNTGNALSHNISIELTCKLSKKIIKDSSAITELVK